MRSSENQSPPPPYSATPLPLHQTLLPRSVHHHTQHRQGSRGHSHQHLSETGDENTCNNDTISRASAEQCERLRPQSTSTTSFVDPSPLQSTGLSYHSDSPCTELYSMSQSLSTGSETSDNNTMSTMLTCSRGEACVRNDCVYCANTNCENGNLRSQTRWYRKYCNQRVPSVVVFGVVAAVFSVTYLYMVVVYRVQPTPVVDEAFHIPQAQKYCQGKFTEWDPKLTTLPGLYLFSIGITGPVSWIMGSNINNAKVAHQDFEFRNEEHLGAPPSQSVFAENNHYIQEKKMDVEENVGVCSVLVLRLVNVLVAPAILLALYSLMCIMHASQSSEWWCLAGSVSLVLLPPLFWFYSLYYTEPLSTMLVLLMMLLHCHSSHIMAAAVGAVSIVVRQTNIVWVVFVLLLLAVDTALTSLNMLVPGNGTPPLSTLHTFHDCKVVWRRVRRLLCERPGALFHLITRVCRACLPYLLLVALFALFVYFNGGLVVGDRSAHEATVHLTQMLYFCLFVVIFSPTLALNSMSAFLYQSYRHPKVTAMLLIVFLMIIHSNTLVHPYLLADNRHYTFYLWNRFYSRYNSCRYLMAPLYLFGAHLVWNVCLEKRSNVFRIVYALCVALSLVPQRLLEPRYFILPFLVARIQRNPCTRVECNYINRGYSHGGDSESTSEQSRRNDTSSSRRNTEAVFRGNSIRGSRQFSSDVASRWSVRGGRGGHSRGGRPGTVSKLARCTNAVIGSCSSGLRSCKAKFTRFYDCFSEAHVGWEFLYYLLINLTTLAIFSTKTFYWRDFAEPQRIMW